VVVDVPEPELLEPPRGPGAQVSLEVVAVDHDGLVAVEVTDRFGGQLLQGHARRPREMLPFVVVAGQDLQHLGALVNELADLLAEDRPGHLGVKPTWVRFPPLREEAGTYCWLISHSAGRRPCASARRR